MLKLEGDDAPVGPTEDMEIDEIETKGEEEEEDDDGWGDDDDQPDEDWGNSPEDDFPDQTSNFNLAKPAKMKREKSYVLMKSDAVDKLMEDTVRPLTDMGFDVSLEHAKRIGHVYDWKIKLAENKMLQDLPSVFKKAGINTDEKKVTLGPPKDKEMECAMCYDDFPGSKFRSYLNCGHSFCQECWVDIVKESSDEGLKCLNLICPQGKACGIALTSRDVKWILADGDPEKKKMSAENLKIWQRYQFWMRKSFVDTSKSLSYCPAPNCEMICQYVAGIKKDLKCSSCNHQWCWRCKHIAHNPSSCEDVEEWERKYNDEGETVKWITVNCKNCPKCKTPIEKNQGCMHMTCRSAMGCGFEFCWLCLGDWKTHGNKTGGYYRCTIYEDKKNKGKYDQEEKDKESLRDEMERYKFHLRMYDDCMKSSGFAARQIPKFEKMVEDKSKKGNLSHNNWDFITKALKEVEQNKRMNAFIYVMLYYLRPQNQQEKSREGLLKEQQALLLTFSDKIQAHLDAHKDDLDGLWLLKGKINDLIRTTSKYRESLRSDLEQRFNKDELTL